MLLKENGASDPAPKYYGVQSMGAFFHSVNLYYPIMC